MWQLSCVRPTKTVLLNIGMSTRCAEAKVKQLQEMVA